MSARSVSPLAGGAAAIAKNSLTGFTMALFLAVLGVAVSTQAVASSSETLRVARCAAKYPPRALDELLGALRGVGGEPPRVFFAALLHNSATLLPGWTAALDRAIGLLGPARTHVSVLESGSSDGTDARLREWASRLSARGVANTILTGAEPPTVFRPFRRGDRRLLRIEFLATLRNEVLAPMLAHNTTAAFDRLVFINDVVFCAGDVLRLLAHGAVSGATLACGLDFHRTDAVGESDFYDKWVQTDLDGRHALPPTIGSGAHERELHKRPGAWLTKAAESAKCGAPAPAPCGGAREAPSQVYCCWNGVAAFDAAPFYAGARFRWAAGLDPAAGGSAECGASECGLICKDLWRLGQGRVVLDPTVQVAYEYRIHADRMRTLAAPSAVPPRVELSAPQPPAWDCYGLSQPGASALAWRARPVRESLVANRGPLPYRPDWTQWPAVVIATALREAAVEAAAAEARERAHAKRVGAAYGALASAVVMALVVLLRGRRARALPAYARLDAER